MNFEIVSHRGCLYGPCIETENKPDQIVNTLSLGFPVEIDVWKSGDRFLLGHDEGKYEVVPTFFNNDMYIHCKNLEAVEYFKNTKLNWFWHNKDKMTLTSKGVAWCYPGVFVSGGITVELGKPKYIKQDILGVCTDYPIKWKEYKESI